MNDPRVDVSAELGPFGEWLRTSVGTQKGNGTDDIQMSSRCRLVARYRVCIIDARSQRC